ncbi:MAG TPA: ABC transporter substrate-binding protein [Ktedonobacterales bacterium]|jgi:alpha-glucoside transport system substrate-binding protein
MPIYERQQREELDQLVEGYTNGSLSRRAFLQRATALGLSLSFAGSILAACGPSSSPSNPTSVDVLNVWSGPEQESFKAVVKPFTDQSGITVKLESTRDLNATLTTRIQGRNPPDIAILPNPGKMQQLAAQGHLISLDNFLDMGQIQSQYSQGWIDLGSYNNKLYALFYKAANKGTVWYSPKQFQANNYQIPKTWDEMIALSDSIATSGKFPWAMGVSSGSASGWPATDWIAEIYLNTSGPDLYDQWVAHKISWTDDSIKNAWKMFGQIAGGKHYINGAPQSILATGFQEASYKPFDTPPTAYMYYLGDFTETFIKDQFKDKVVAGTDFDFFPFPTINQQFANSLTGGADVVTALTNNSAVKQLVQYMATPAAQAIWVKRGGFTATNKSVDASSYPDQVAAKSASSLASAAHFRFGAGDLMPSQVQNAFWAGVLKFIGDQSQLDSVLGEIEGIAQQAYTG